MALIGKNEAVQDRARHDLANDAAKRDAELTLRVNSLERDTIRREELVAIMNRIDDRFEGITKSLSHVGVLEERVNTLIRANEKVLAKFNDR